MTHGVSFDARPSAADVASSLLHLGAGQGRGWGGGMGGETMQETMFPAHGGHAKRQETFGIVVVPELARSLWD